MKQNIEFDRWEPPVLTEDMLIHEMERRKKRGILLVLLLSSFISNLAMAAIMVYISRYSAVATVVCIGIFVMNILVTGTVILMFTFKRREKINELIRF